PLRGVGGAPQRRRLRRCRGIEPRRTPRRNWARNRASYGRFQCPVRLRSRGEAVAAEWRGVARGGRVAQALRGRGRRRRRVAASARDRKSTRLNSSHSQISYAVFCLKKKKKESARVTSKCVM